MTGAAGAFLLHTLLSPFFTQRHCGFLLESGALHTLSTLKCVQGEARANS